HKSKGKLIWRRGKIFVGPSSKGIEYELEKEDGPMQRTARILLAVVLAEAVHLPTAAAANTVLRLPHVSQQVKERMNLSESYTTLYGELTEEGMHTCWTLHWEKEGEAVRVVAGEDGTIYRYDRSREDDTGRGDSQSAFPALSRAEALPYAQAFVD